MKELDLQSDCSGRKIQYRGAMFTSPSGVPGHLLQDPGSPGNRDNPPGRVLRDISADYLITILAVCPRGLQLPATHLEKHEYIPQRAKNVNADKQLAPIGEPGHGMLAADIARRKSSAHLESTRLVDSGTWWSLFSLRIAPQHEPGTKGLREFVDSPERMPGPSKLRQRGLSAFLPTPKLSAVMTAWG